MLESLSHSDSSFATLTYDNENLPKSASLDPKDAQKFIKRLRKRLGQNRPLRYYLVGEYGDSTERPHYHAALFGVSEQETDLVDASWGLGHVHLGTLTPDSSQYIAGYVTKKLTAPDDPRLCGRYPEFARMSNRPGIGALSVGAFAESLTTEHGSASIVETGDVPVSFRAFGRSNPLGRYMRRKLREYLDFETVGGQPKHEEARLAEMFALLDDSGLSPRQFKETKPFLERQKMKQIEGKHRIYSGKGKL